MPTAVGGTTQVPPKIRRFREVFKRRYKELKIPNMMKYAMYGVVAHVLLLAILLGLAGNLAGATPIIVVIVLPLVGLMIIAKAYDPFFINASCENGFRVGLVGSFLVLMGLTPIAMLAFVAAIIYVFRTRDACRESLKEVESNE